MSSESSGGASFPEEVLYLISAPGVRDVPEYICPSAALRVTGHFTGEEFDYHEWAEVRGLDLSYYDPDDLGFEGKSPLFEATSWCVLWVHNPWPVEEECEDRDDQDEEMVDVETCGTEEEEDPAAVQERAWREAGLTFDDACPEFQRVE